MDKQAPSLTGFVLKVDGIKGLCPAGEAWANRQIEERATPVLSCEGACIRGEIARLAAGMVAEEAGYLPPKTHTIGTGAARATPINKLPTSATPTAGPSNPHRPSAPHRRA